MKQWLNTLTTVFRAYSGIFFLYHPFIGILAAGVTLVRPRMGLAGLLCAAAAYAFARLIHMDRVFLSAGYYLYNPLLVGLAMGYLFKPAFPVILLVLIAGVFTFICTMVMANFFSVYLRLPVLSFPFVIISTIVYLASRGYVHLAVNETFADALARYLPLWLSGYFQSLGAVFFIPQVGVGVVIALCILLSSRILFMLSLMGYYAGTAFTALMVGSFSSAFTDTAHFNAVLAAMAVGGIFLIPSLKSYILALTAAGVSTVLIHSLYPLWWYAKIPGFALTFNITVLIFIYALQVSRYPRLTQVAKATPEESLDWYVSNRHRGWIWDKSIMLPFSGKWTVWQEFDGPWTHRGNWKYAYDFIITDAGGSSYRGTGNRPEDYYAWGKPVLSPVRGTVVRTVAHLPDNPIGQPDKVNNWGNYVIIRDRQGFFVEISHFSSHSIRVSEGDEVERGTFLGLCGNSGYSTQPHIHVQVQLTAEISPPVPFVFASYTDNNCFKSAGLPRESSVVEPLYWGNAIDAVTSAAVGEVHRYDVIKKGEMKDRLNLVVCMAADGTLYFDSGRGRLYFGKRNGTFYFYSLEGRDPYLKAMFTALPRFPLACRQSLHWQEPFPAGALLKGFGKGAVQFLASFYHHLAGVEADFFCPRKNSIKGTIRSRFPGLKTDTETTAEWDERNGFTVFKVEGLELRKRL